MSARTSPPTPYAGLRPYSEDDAPFFFGRDRVREIIIDNLKAKRLTLVYGASGVGKSSVLRAGVEYALLRRAQENLEEKNSPQFAVAVFREWRDDPIAGLRKCVQEAVSQTLGEGVDEPASPPDSLPDSLQNLAERIGGDLFIILDQFEDYFLYRGEEQGQGTFSFEFPRLVNRADLRVNFLISIRDDAYYKLARFRDRVPSIFDNALQVLHLDIESGRAAIEQPIEQFNRFYASSGQRIRPERELVEEVLRQVRTGHVFLSEGGRGDAPEGDHATQTTSIETPYLQLVMTELWKAEMRLGSTILRRQTLDDLGGAQKIVEKHFREAVGKLSEHEKELAHSAFKYLVTRSRTTIAYTASDLAESTESDKSEIKFLLEKLSSGSNRILRTFAPPDREGEERYEIFHDVLAQPVLDWCAQYQQELRIREEKRKSDERLAEEKRNAFEQRKLAAASARADEQAKVAAILRLKNRALALATAAAVIAAAIAYWQYTRAEQARRKSVVVGNVLSDVLAKQYAVLLSPEDAAKAAQNLRETVDLLNKTRENYQHDGVPIGEGITLNNIASIYREAGRSASSAQDWDAAQNFYQRAKETYQEARSILEGALGPINPNVATSLHDQAYVHMLMGEYEAAEHLFRRTLSILESAIGPDSTYAADAAVSLAHCCTRQGKYSEAESLYERALRIRRLELRADHPELAESLNYLAWIQFEQGKYNQAEPHFKDALAIWQAAPEPQHSDAAFSLEGLAAIYRQRGKYKEAADYLNQALEAQAHSFEQDNLLAAQYDDSLALLYEAQNDPQSVLVALDAYQIRENGLGTDHPETAYSATILASCYLKSGNYADAEKYFNIALKIQQALPSSPELARTSYGLAQLYTRQGKLVEAEPLFKNALAIQEKAIPGHPDLAKTLDAYAKLLERADRKTAADELRSRADRIRQTHARTNPDN